MVSSHGVHEASYLLSYLLLALVHLLSGMQMDQPLILADELGYLGHARFLSGTAPLPDMFDRQFYHFGYSLFLLPAFRLFEDPVWSYKAVMVVNALLAAAVFFPLRFILASFLEVSDRAARWIAFACSLYPSLVLYSSFAWSENAFIPLFALAVAIFGRYLASKSSTDLVLFALVAGFLYTVYPRALPVLVARPAGSGTPGDRPAVGRRRRRGAQVHPLVHLMGGLDLYRISFLVLASFVAITLLMRLSRRGGLALLVLLFALFAWANHRQYLLPLAGNAESRLAFADRAIRLGPIPTVSHDTSHREAGFLAGIQYLLPQNRLPGIRQPAGRPAPLGGGDRQHRMVPGRGPGGPVRHLERSRYRALGSAGGAAVASAQSRLPGCDPGGGTQSRYPGDRFLRPGVPRGPARTMDERCRYADRAGGPAQPTAADRDRGDGSRAGGHPAAADRQRRPAVEPVDSVRALVAGFQPPPRAGRRGTPHPDR